MANISLRGVQKVYPSGYEAVKNFNLEIQDGDFVVVVGPSGCGKTTVRKMIAGYEDITSGELYFNDVLMNDVPLKERKVAMMFQNYALYPNMTVYENLALGLKLRHVEQSELDRKVNEMAQILDLEPIIDRYPKGLSEGQKQRLAMGRAAICEPDIFLIELPDLDSKLKGQMRVVLQKLNKKLGLTILYVTGDPEEAMTLGNKIVVMNAHEIQQVGTAKEIYEEPADLFVAQYFGKATMNILNATCEVQGEEVILDLHESKIKIGGQKAKRLIDGGYDGKDILIGIRPEDVHDEPAIVNASPNTVVESKIILHERVDVEMRLRFEFAGVRVSARVDLRTKNRTGDVVKFAFIEDKIQLFDKDTEEAIFGETNRNQVII